MSRNLHLHKSNIIRGRKDGQVLHVCLCTKTRPLVYTGNPTVNMLIILADITTSSYIIIFLYAIVYSVGEYRLGWGPDAEITKVDRTGGKK